MSTVSSASIVSKVWNYPPSHSALRRTCAQVLKNAGVSYGDSVEQITYLLFLKLAEQHQILAQVKAGTTAINLLQSELNRQIARSTRLLQSTLATAFSENPKHPIINHGI